MRLEAVNTKQTIWGRVMQQFFEYLFLTLMYRPTGNETFDLIIYLSSFFLELAAIDSTWAIVVFNCLLQANEILYLSIILQWLICVDYSLHHNMDHIRRRYRHAAQKNCKPTDEFLIRRHNYTVQELCNTLFPGKKGRQMICGIRK